MEHRSKLDLYHLMEMYKIFFHLNKEDIESFYQRKFEYYQFFVKLVVIGMSLTSLGYLLSDAQLNDGQIMPTLLPRTAILVPLVLYIILENVSENYRFKIFLNYAQIHFILYSSIWSGMHVTDHTHFAEGVFSLNLAMLVVGFASRGTAGILSYIIFLAELIFAQRLIGYSNFYGVFTLILPCVIAVILAQQILNLSFLEHYMVEVKLEHSLVTDSLTKVYNRHKLTEMLDDNQLRGFAKPSVIVMADIDFFKKINDTYGHYKGDEVLQYLGSTLCAFVRKSDCVIRYGGEEFLILMNDCEVREACERIERVRKEIAESKNKPLDFTISAGITEYDGQFEEALKRADALLYESKENGRDQITMCDWPKETHTTE